MAERNPGPLVIVGVDGSEQAQAALAWAAGYAETSGGRLCAVIAWDYPVGFGYLPPGPVPAVDFEADAVAAMESSITEVRKDHQDVPIETRVVHGYPSQVLLRMAEGADLLVVGSHGRGAFAEALLGSVSHRCAHHAPCPVVVVRDAAGAADA
jgi:nucleotide-binding universal stress UspA family protein